MNLRIRIGLGFLVSMATITSGSYAQEVTDDLLAGPTVQDEDVTQQDMQAERSRVTGKNGNSHQNRQQIRVWMNTLQSLALTQNQQTEITSLVEQLQKARAAFQKKYGKEMRDLREKSNAAKKNGSDIPDEVGSRTRELQTMSPNPEEYQAKAWALLSEEQQHSFQQKYQAELEKLEKSLEKRKGNHDPMMDEMDEPKKGSGSKNFPFRDRNRPQKDERQFDRNNQDDVSLRRARFLRRLQKLQNDS